tara:strand:+ start:1104 stop:1412 length:309 start_codon:yes stop_codon:yes gene_type:complete
MKIEDIRNLIRQELIKNTKQDVRDTVNEVHEPQHVDNEGRMAKSQLYKLKNYAEKLEDMITDTEQLEGWVQSKITKAADYLSSVAHYLEYEKSRDFSEEGEE